MLSGLRPRHFANSLVMLNFLGEAIDAGLAQPLADTLRTMGAKVAGIFMVPNQGNADYPWQLIPHWCANHTEWLDRFQRAYPRNFNLQTDRRLICLNRRHSPVRSKVVRRLLQHFPEREILISHECLQGIADTGQIRLLDGPVGERRQHRAPDPQWLRAAVKVITEGNEQHMHNVPETVLVSEKTFKCFAWRQFPIWISVPGTVQAVRDMQFDVFDDLFNGHDYDTIQDQQLRVKTALDCAVNFAKQPIWKLQDIRKRHLDRLQENHKKLCALAKQRDQDFVRIRTQFVKMFADNHDFRV